MSDRVYNVLILCTGNSARSILAEALVNERGKGRFRAYSAGSHPAGRVNPFAIELLKQMRFPIEGLRSKHWNEFARGDAPPLDFIFTVCDNAAGETCPIWPGHPMTAHWGIEDPAGVHGSDQQKRAAFAEAFRLLSRRVDMFVNLPISSMDSAALKHKLREIGEA